MPADPQPRTSRPLWSSAASRRCRASCARPTTGYASRRPARSSTSASTSSTEPFGYSGHLEASSSARQLGRHARCLYDEPPISIQRHAPLAGTPAHVLSFIPIHSSSCTQQALTKTRRRPRAWSGQTGQTLSPFRGLLSYSTVTVARAHGRANASSKPGAASCAPPRACLPATSWCQDRHRGPEASWCGAASRYRSGRPPTRSKMSAQHSPIALRQSDAPRRTTTS
jgi:hypothetical protein